jgi:phage terminase large subunit GpA-like protein
MSAVLEAPTSLVVPRTTRTAIARAVREGLRPMRAVPPIKLADWAVKHFKLVGDSSHKTGDWVPWPPQVGIMDALSDDRVEEVDVKKAKRVGYTKILVAFAAYEAAHRNRKFGLWQPTDDDRDNFVASEIDPMIEECAVVQAARRPGARANDSIRYKRFRGSVQHYLGAKAARAFRRITLDDAVLDEVDGMDQQVEKSSDPITLSGGRLEGAPFPKHVIGGTPRNKGLSHIERRVGNAKAVLRFCIECPHCEAEHPLMWGGSEYRYGFKWEPGKPETVRHVCPHCFGEIRQADYERIAGAFDAGLLTGQVAWVCQRTGLRYGADREWRNERRELVVPPRHIAYDGYWTAYSQQRSWADIVEQYEQALKAKEAGDSGPMMGFVNEVLAETWEEDFEQTEADALRKRAELEKLPLGIVPRGACVIFGAVDVQKDRWEYAVWAFGRDGESWCIDYQVVPGTTSDYKEWIDKLAPVLDRTYPHATGARLKFDAFAVDTGYQTHQAYAFCREYKSKNVRALKGDGTIGKPIKSTRSRMDINYRGRVLKRGVELWHLGTDTAKDLLHGRLQLEGAGPGRVHFAEGLSQSFFDGLVAEQRVPERNKRGVVQQVWVLPSGKRNEPLDCTTMCMWCYEWRDLNKWTEQQWMRAEAALEPDLFMRPHAPASAVVEPEQASVEVPPVAQPKRPRPAPAAALASDEWMGRI